VTSGSRRQGTRAGRHGLDALLARLVSGGAPVAIAATAGGLANVLDNLPAYLALERVVPVHSGLALLVGVDTGPLVLPWASLATLLWADRCRAAGVPVSWPGFAARGLLLGALVVPACALALG
jgi:arsenical pump membrane protein